MSSGRRMDGWLRMTLGLAVLVLLLPVPLQAATPPSVLILHSYHPDFSWTAQIAAGMTATLNAAADPPRIQVEYLDTRRYPEPAYRLGLMEEVLRYKLADRPYDLILLSDNHALEFVLRHRQDLFADVPAVFCGINYFVPALLSGTRGITGVVEAPSHQATIATALQLHPRTDQLVVIGSSISEMSGAHLRAEIEAAFTEMALPQPVTYLEGLSLEELEATVGELPVGNLILLNSGELRNDAGAFIPPEQSLQRLRAVSPAPIYSFWDILLGDGIVGGKLVSPRHLGELAASMGLRILAGESPDSLPVIYPADANLYRFDYRELQRFDIPLTSLPEGSDIVHRPPPFFTLSKRQLWIGLGVLTLLCLGLLVGVIDRIRAGRILRRFRAEKMLILDNTSDIIVYYGADHRVLWANRAASESLNLTPKELPGKRCYEVWHQRKGPCEHCPVIRCRSSHRLEESEQSTPDGRAWLVRAKPVQDEKGQIVGVVEVCTDITARKQANRNLQETQARLLTVLQTLPDLVWLKDTEGIYLACNPVFERYFGTKEDQIVGKTDYDFVDRDRADIFRQKDREAMATGHACISEEWVTFADNGHRSLLETRKVPVKSAEGAIIGVLGIGRDITERKQAEEALRASEERYRALVDNINVGIYRSTGGEGRYLQVNPAMVKIFGFDSVQEMLDTPVVTLYRDPTDRAAFQALLEEKGAVHDHILHLRRKDGTPVDCSCSATAQFDENGDFKWMEGILEDISELQLALQRLERANRDLESFAYTVSHDLRSPLTAILGFAETLLELEGDNLRPESREYLDIIIAQGERMQALTEDTLQLAQVGQVSSPTVPIAVEAVLMESLDRLKARSMADIRLDTQPGLQVPIPATLLSQLFDNLIGNALRYGVTNRQPIEIAVHYDSPLLRLRVLDHGPGIPTEEREKVFDVFYRGSSGSHRRGTGIGLATVAKIAEHYQGQARVEETPGGGCTFTVELRTEAVTE